jgi:hypothetical protein
MPRNSLDDWIDEVCEADPPPIEGFEEPQRGRRSPLILDELQEGFACLVQWQSSATFNDTTRAMCSRCHPRDFFNQPQLKFLHDAHVLAEFAQQLKEVEAVRLASATDQWPDGFVRIGDEIHNIEVTSTHGGRKLGKEYRVTNLTTLDPVENWIARADSIPKYLEDAIRQKSEKKYSSPCLLIVYLNINEYGVR